MTKLTTLRRAAISAGMLLSAGQLSGAILLNVTAGAPQSILEGNATTVTFTVTNPNVQTYILDYAIAVITGPKVDDFLQFDSVSFPTLFPFNVPQTFTYGVSNPDGNTNDPDNGLNTIAFEIEASPATATSVPQFLTAKGLGFFVYRSTGGSLATSGPAAQTFADLNACTTAPAANPANPCPKLAGDPHLYDVPTDVTATVIGIPQPVTTTVNLLDAPEPSTAGLAAFGVLALLAGLRYRARQVRA